MELIDALLKIKEVVFNGEYDEIRDILPKLSEKSSIPDDKLLSYFDVLFLYKKELDKSDVEYSKIESEETDEGDEDSKKKRPRNWSNYEKEIIRKYISDTKDFKPSRQAFNDISQLLFERTPRAVDLQYYNSVKPQEKKVDSFVSIEEKEIVINENPVHVQLSKDKNSTDIQQGTEDEVLSSDTTVTSEHNLIDNETKNNPVHNSHNKDTKSREYHEVSIIDSNNISEKSNSNDDILDSLTTLISNAQTIKGLDLNSIFRGLSQLSMLAVNNQQDSYKIEELEEKLIKIENEHELNIQQKEKELEEKAHYIDSLEKEVLILKSDNKELNSELLNFEKSMEDLKKTQQSTDELEIHMNKMANQSQKLSEMFDEFERLSGAEKITTLNQFIKNSKEILNPLLEPEIL